LPLLNSCLGHRPKRNLGSSDFPKSLEVPFLRKRPIEWLRCSRPRSLGCSRLQPQRDREPLSRLRVGGFAIEGEVAVADADLDGLAVMDLALQDLLGQRVLHIFLDHAL
jgi:hypothetical protein